MREEFKKYRLTSTEEPTDEMLQELMEDVAKVARESSAKAEEAKRKMMEDAFRLMNERRLLRQNQKAL